MATVSFARFSSIVLSQTSHGKVFESSAKAFYRHYERGEMTFNQAVDGCARDCDMECEYQWDNEEECFVRVA